MDVDNYHKMLVLIIEQRLFHFYRFNPHHDRPVTSMTYSAIAPSLFRDRDIALLRQRHLNFVSSANISMMQ